MNKIFTKTVVNFYGIAFIACGLAAIFLRFKQIVAALILASIGIALLRRKAFGVYATFFMSFVMAGVGLILIAMPVFGGISHHNFKFDMLVLMGLAPIIFSFFTFYFFTRPAVAQEFGLQKIVILEKVDKKQLITCGRVLLWIGIIVGLVLLACYIAARLIK